MAVELSKDEMNYVDSVAQVFLNKALPEKSLNQEHVTSLAQYAYSAALKTLEIRNDLIKEKIVEPVPEVMPLAVQALNEEALSPEAINSINSINTIFNHPAQEEVEVEVESKLMEIPVTITPEAAKKKTKQSKKKKKPAKKKLPKKVKINPLSTLDQDPS